jgi:predicted acetyltransferase
MELVLPNEKYKESFIEGVKEFQAEDQKGSDYSALNINDIEKDFESYVEKIKSQAEGKNLKPGYISHTTFWIVENGRYIGDIDVRHQLTENLKKVGGHIGYHVRPSERKKGYGKQALKMVIPYAKKLGIEKALVTCDSTNIGSRKIIESNGGILENEVPGENGGPSKLRFWIDLN